MCSSVHSPIRPIPATRPRTGRGGMGETMKRDEFDCDAASPASVDLRSDTVTQPTEAMYARMRAAPLGDDGLEGDPTARALEEAAAAILDKEAGLFVPSCTMGNLRAI